jgi:elongation factor P
MYETSDIRKGLKVEIDGDPYIVIDFQFVKPGKGNAFTRTKLRNMKTGNVLERTYKSGEKFTPANLEEKQMQFLYVEGEQYCFMDTKTYDQVFLTPEQVADVKDMMPENILVDILFHSGEAIGVTLPNFVELEVVSSEPGVKGDTSSGATKPATLSTGYTINVPLFVEEGEVLRIDTRTGSYVERVKVSKR